MDLAHLEISLSPACGMPRKATMPPRPADSRRKRRRQSEQARLFIIFLYEK
jgi:hypothetical protein